MNSTVAGGLSGKLMNSINPEHVREIASPSKLASMPSDEVAQVQLEGFLLEIENQISVPLAKALVVDQHSQVYPIGHLISKNSNFFQICNED